MTEHVWIDATFECSCGWEPYAWESDGSHMLAFERHLSDVVTPPGQAG